MEASTGVKAKELNDEYLLFEFSSRIEAERVKMGRWVFNDKELVLDWCLLFLPATGNIVNPDIFGSNYWAFYPISGQNLFKAISDRYGGFIDLDDDTRYRRQLRWARICVKNFDFQFPATS